MLSLKTTAKETERLGDQKPNMLVFDVENL